MEIEKEKEPIENIWSENAQKFMELVHTSQMRVLHPALAAMINAQNPKYLLDYGCGDGRILQLINEQIKNDVFDKNAEMLVLARLKNANRIRDFFNTPGQIGDSIYDAVLLSMVLVCIESESEFLKVLIDIKRVKTEAGMAYIAVSHPCFRDKQFSNCYTSYGNGQPFRYLDDGQPFNVFIEDEMPPSVAFTDFHWTLSFTINKIVEAGMSVVEMRELPDDAMHPKYNSNPSLFLIIVAQ